MHVAARLRDATLHWIRDNPSLGVRLLK